MALIILEGVDNVGKSTLAQKLCKKYKLKLIKVNAPNTKNPFDEYVEMISKLNPREHYLFDRFYLGEFAYGPVYRKKCGLSDVQQFYIEQLLMKFNPLLVYCWLDHNEIAKNFMERGEDKTNFEDIPKLEKQFELGFERSCLPRLKYNYKLDKFPYCPNKKLFELKFSYVGNANPLLLFVGDEPNYNMHLRSRKPYQVFNSSSGMFLMEALKKCGLNFGLINSKEGDELITKDDIRKINPLGIIALGKNASDRMFSIGMIHFNLDHPQYAKRFYGKNALEKYVQKIKELI